jgi:hypothetical protein
MGAIACHSAKESLAAPPKEVGKLGQLVGKWHSKSRRLATSLNDTSPLTEFNFECRWTLDKYDIACSQVADIGGQKVREVDVFGYSEHAKLYTMMVVLDVGVSSPRIFSRWFAWDKDTWRFLPQDGLRSTWEIKSPDYHLTRTERSGDGINWTVSSTGEHRRLP